LVVHKILLHFVNGLMQLQLHIRFSQNVAFFVTAPHQVIAYERQQHSNA